MQTQKKSALKPKMTLTPVKTRQLNVAAVATLWLVAIVGLMLTGLPALNAVLSLTATPTYPLSRMPSLGNIADVCLSGAITDKPACYQGLYRFACSQPVAILPTDYNSSVNPFTDARLTMPCADFCRLYYGKINAASEGACRALAINFAGGNPVMSANLDGTPNLSSPIKTDPNLIAFNATKAQAYCSTVMTAIGYPVTHNWYTLCFNNVTNFLNAASPSADGYAGFKRYLIDRLRFLQPAVCGNGKVETGEQCDDGNANDSDGCMSNCQLTPTWAMANSSLDMINNYWLSLNPNFGVYLFSQMDLYCSVSPISTDCIMTGRKSANYSGYAQWVCQNYPVPITAADPKFISCMQVYGLTPAGAAINAKADKAAADPLVNCAGMRTDGNRWLSWGVPRSKCTLDQAITITYQDGLPLTYIPYHYCDIVAGTCTYYNALAVGQKESAIVDTCVKDGGLFNPQKISAACSDLKSYLCCDNQIGYNGVVGGNNCLYVPGTKLSFPICSPFVCAAGGKTTATAPLTKAPTATDDSKANTCCPKDWGVCGDSCCRPAPFQSCKHINILVTSIDYCSNDKCLPNEKTCKGGFRDACCNQSDSCDTINTGGKEIGICVPPDRGCKKGDPGYCGTGNSKLPVCCGSSATCVPKYNYCSPLPSTCKDPTPQFCQGTGKKSEYTTCCVADTCFNWADGTPYCKNLN